MKIKISIIITARNYSRYIEETLLSCINQSVKPHEVIYSDDFSTDNSIDIASKLDVIIVEQQKHVGVVVARNAGVKKSTGNVLVHVDGDDILTPDYLEKHLESFDEITPFVYGAAQAFGLKNNLWKVKTWKDTFIWNRNFVNTSAMIWKDKFLKAGGWMENKENTMWDWSLALRLSRLGTPRKSNAVLLYRQHYESWSTNHSRTKDEDNFKNSVNIVRKELVRVTIGLIYSGRLPNLMREWMDCLIDDISILKNKPEFIIINNSGKDINFIKKAELKKFSKVKIITGTGKLEYISETDRRNKVCELLSECYNIILENSTSELIHMREDDIIPEKFAFQKIFDYVTDGVPVIAAATGVYLNRNAKSGQKFVGGFYNMQNPRATSGILKIETKNPFQVDFAGTGFIIFWKKLSPIYKPYIGKIQAHDWAWSLDLKKSGQKLVMLPDAKCKHYNDEQNYILPKINNHKYKMSENHIIFS